MELIARQLIYIPRYVYRCKAHCAVAQETNENFPCRVESCYGMNFLRNITFWFTVMQSLCNSRRSNKFIYLFN